MTILSSVKMHERENLCFLKVPARSLDRVRERSKNTEFKFFPYVVTGNVEKGAPSQLLLVDLEWLE